MKKVMYLHQILHIRKDVTGIDGANFTDRLIYNGKVQQR